MSFANNLEDSKQICMNSLFKTCRIIINCIIVDLRKDLIWYINGAYGGHDDDGYDDDDDDVHDGDGL